MTEADRLIDSGSEDERALLRAALRDRAPRAVRAHVLASLGVASGVAVSAGSASAGMAGIVKWLGAGLVAGTLVSGGATLLNERPAAQQDGRAQVMPVPPVAVTADRAGRAPEMAPSPASPPAAAGPAKKPVPAGAPQVVPTDARSLAEELASLDRARAALASGDARRALRELDRHAQEFPKGALAPESQVLRIESLVRAGQKAKAATLARHFLELYGRGPHASRVRSLLAQAEASSSSSAFPPSD